MLSQYQLKIAGYYNIPSGNVKKKDFSKNHNFFEK